MSSQENQKQAWYNGTLGMSYLSIASLLLAYLVGSRAIFTGSLQQYVLTFILLILAVNRSIVAVRQYKEQYRG